MCFILFSEQTTIIFLNCKNLLVFVMVETVFSDLPTLFLNIILEQIVLHSVKLHFLFCLDLMFEPCILSEWCDSPM
jgi:hypothetical protein